jgi:hypothetical protein
VGPRTAPQARTWRRSANSPIRGQTSFHHDVISICRAKLGDDIPTKAVTGLPVFGLRLTRSPR